MTSHSSPRFRLLALAAGSLFASLAPQTFAQDATPAAPIVGVTYAKPHVPVSRLDLYGGYGYFHPVNSDINNNPYLPINRGAVASVTGYFNRYLGLQAEGSFFPHGPNDCVYTAQAGPVARLQKGRFVPFLHALGGGAKVGGPVFQPCTWGWGVTGGVGVDYIVQGLGDHLALRPIQADFEYSQVNYGPLIIPAGVSGGFGEIHAYRLSTGLVLRFGDLTPPEPIAMSCAVQPSTVFPGDPLTVTASASNLNPKRPVTFAWTSTGGTIAGTDATANVSTAGLAPGSYTIAGRVTQGPKANQTASCTSGFTVRAYDPPTLSCSANPSTVMAGDSSVITSAGVSPQNRTLTYSYSATAGQIAGATSTATLATAGAPAGPIQITCSVVDDLGKLAIATTSVNVQVPVIAPKVETRELCSISFDRDQKRPLRVDNEAKGCLDDIALALQRETGSRLVIVGNHVAGEAVSASGERALNVQQYLTQEKGIDASRIELRQGDAATRTVTNTLVPTGATFSGGAQPVDAASVQRHGQPYGKPKAARPKK